VTESRIRAGKILLLAPRIYGAYGGVPSYMQRLVEICSDCCAVPPQSVICLAMQDSGCQPVLPACALYVRHSGKAAFALRAARLAKMQKPDLVIVGHLGLAPVAWLLHRSGWIGNYIIVLHGIEAWRKVAWT